MVTGYLLDTHTLIWWWIEPDKLSQKVLTTISNPDSNIIVSSASMWEMATKHRKGKLADVDDILKNFASLLQADNLLALPITWQHAQLSGQLPQSHADPFDRMLVAQTKIEKLTLISCDEALKSFDVDLFW